MKMDEGMDTGPVFSIHRVPVGPLTTADELAEQLGHVAAEVVRQDLARAVDGRIVATPQDHGRATVAPMLKKADGRIPWNLSAPAVCNHVRGMTSWPGAFTGASGRLLKVLASQVAQEGPTGLAPGTVVSATKAGVTVACGTGALAILRGQIEGRKPVSGAELVAGRTLAEGMVLGDLNEQDPAESAT